MKRICTWLTCAALIAPAASAQQSGRGSAPADTSGIIVKTIPLHHLSNTDAVLLLSPYVAGRNGAGGVYTVGQSIHAVTVRGYKADLVEVERLLAQYDRSPLTVSLNFQLIAADYTTKRDPSLAGLDSVLRSVLKFTGYHLLTVAVVNVSEGSMASQQLSADGQDYRLSYDVTDVSGTGTDATVHLRVDLRRAGPVLLSTGVTIPIGHTVVLGSTAETASKPGAKSTSANGEPTYIINGVPQPSNTSAAASVADHALILTVRPTVTPPSKDD